MSNTIYRGEIHYATLSPVVGSEQGGVRPVLIVQNNVGNKHAPTTLVAPITSATGKHTLPTHIVLDKSSCGLKTTSIVLLEQIRVIDKSRLSGKVGVLSNEQMIQVDKGIKISLGL